MDKLIRAGAQNISSSINSDAKPNQEVPSYAHLTEPRGARILVVEDHPVQRAVMQGWLKQAGYDAIVVDHGEAALAALAHQAIDVVLLDLYMGVEDNIGLAQTIRQRCAESYLPILLMTAEPEPRRRLTAWMQGDVDDVLVKPFDFKILLAKLSALLRIRRLHALVRAHEQALEEEHQAGKAIWAHVFSRGDSTLAGLTYRCSPLTLFNGDVLLVKRTPQGGVHLLLGDFTGHGLSAAIGVGPLAMVFYRMTAKGCSLEDILHEMHQSLQLTLPVNMFCCALALHWDPKQQTLQVWSGGMPTGYVTHQGNLQILKSQDLALGIRLPNRTFTPETFHVNAGERVFLCSDGVTELFDSKQEMWGEERWEACIQTVNSSATPLEDIEQTLTTFQAGATPSDDKSLVVWELLSSYEG